MKFGRGDAALAATALAVRVLVAVQVGALPIARNPQYDSLEYLTWARHLAAGDFRWPVPPPHGPGYPFFLGALLAVSGGSLLFARIAQAVVGTLTCFFVARAGERLFGARAGLLAGFALALYAPLAWLDVSILAEGLLVSLLAASIWCASAKRGVGAGVLLGLATIVRPTAILFLPLLAMMAAEAWRRRAVIAAVCVATIAPVTIVNYLTCDAFIPVQAFGGMNFYLGNSPERDGLASARPGGDWERLEPAPLRAGITDAAAQDRWFVAKTRADIAAQPGRFLALLGRKLVWTFQNAELRDTHSFAFFERASPPLRFLPHFTLLFALACAGACAVSWRERAPRYVAAYVLIAALSCVALVVGARYRIPMVPGLALFAGAALASRPNRKQLAMMVAAALLGGAETRAWRHAPSENLAEEWTLDGEALLKLGDPAGAEREYRLAIEADPRYARAWDSLGSLLAQRGARAEAHEAFVRAATLNGWYARPQRHLATFAEESKDVAGAIAAYRRCVALDPRDVRAYQRLGDLLTSTGQLEEAISAYQRAQSIDPDNRDVLLSLARLYGAAGEPAKGALLADNTLTRFGGSGDEWLLLATLAADARDIPTAERAVDEARAKLGWSDNVLFTAALVRYRQGRPDAASQLLQRVKTPNEQVRRLGAIVANETGR